MWLTPYDLNPGTPKKWTPKLSTPVKYVTLKTAMEYLSSREEDIEFSIERHEGQEELVLNLTDVTDELESDGFLDLFC
ncbi:hypothetical protein MBANPS3_012626 [Mucor bainieri]